MLLVSAFNFVQSVHASVVTAAFNVHSGVAEAEASVVTVVTAPKALVTSIWLLLMVVRVAI